VEDHQIIKVKAIELVEDVDNVALEDLSSLLLVEALHDIPLIQTNITLLTSPNRFDPAELLQNISIENLNKPSVNDKVLIVAGFNLLTKRQSLKRLLPFLREGGCVLTREKCDVTDSNIYSQQYEFKCYSRKAHRQRNDCAFKEKSFDKTKKCRLHKK